MLKPEFERRIASAKAQRPMWFELERDEPALVSDLEEVEQALNTRLSPEYRDFLLFHGAGHFAFIKVLGVCPGTDWFLLDHVQGLPSGFIPVADNHAGDYYGLVVADGEYERSIAFWDHETNQLRDHRFDDFYTLVASVGLSPDDKHSGYPR